MRRTKTRSSPSQLGRLNLVQFAPTASLFFVFFFGCTLLAHCASEEVGARAAPTGSSQQLSSHPSEPSRLRQRISAHDNDQIKKWKQQVGNRRGATDWSTYKPEICFPYENMAGISDSAGQIDYYFDSYIWWSQECWWSIQVPGAAAISVSFSEFDMETDGSFVSLFACDSDVFLDEECYLVSSFPHTGHTLPAPVTVSNWVLFVKFESEAKSEAPVGTNLKGFVLDYTTITAPTCEANPSAALNASQGTVEYFVEGVNYPKNLHCVWILAPSEHVTSFTFDIVELDTQYGNDFVKFFSCTDITEDLTCLGETEVLVFSGNSSFGQTGQIVVSRYAKITFQSDNQDSYSDNGFKVQYTASNGDCPSGYSVRVDDAEIGTVDHFFETDSYQSNSRCWWFLDPPDEWSQMSIAITELDTEDYFDMVHILNCPDRSRVSTDECTVLAEFSGNSVPLAENSAVVPILSSSYTTVLFTSDYGVQKQGFKLQYSAATSDGVSCPSFNYAQAFTGTEMSGSVTFWFDEEYPANANCYWIFAPEGGNETTTFSFTVALEELATEESYDFVEIMRCSEAVCSLLEWEHHDKEYSGEPLPADIPRVPSFVGRALMVAFSSDGLVSKKGFKLSFTAAMQSSGGGSEGSAGASDGLCSDFAQSQVCSNATGVIEYKPPGGYGSDDHCHWIIAPLGSGPENRYQIELKVNEYSLNYCDKLSVHQCATVDCAEDGRQLLLFQMTPWADVVTAEVAMLVEFSACSFVVPDQGFIVEYTSEPPACPPMISTGANSGDIIFQPEGGYKSNQRCSWVLPLTGRPLDDGQSFVLSFQSFSTELTFDVLQVLACQSFDPNCDYGVLVQEWSGSGPTASNTVSSPYIMIKFESDDYRQPSDGGFWLQYTVSSAASGGGGDDPSSGNATASPLATCSGMEDPARVFTKTGDINYWFENGEYPGQRDCVWIISPIQASMVTLTIEEIDTERNYDVVTVFECDTAVCDSGRQLGSYSGNFQNSKSMTGASTSGILLLRFQSDTGVGGRGFKASWTTTGGIDANCQLKKVQPTAGSEGAGISHLDYTNNQHCSWIVSSAENTQLKVSFTTFDTEKSFDSVRMWSCLDENCDQKVLENELSGNEFDVRDELSQGGQVPAEMEKAFSTNYMLIEFDSDSSDTGGGFVVKYEELESDSKQRTGCPHRDQKSAEENIQTIKFPEVQTEYGDMLLCSWVISIPQEVKDGETILEFVTIDTEIDSDFVRVYGCPTTTAGLADCDSDKWLISELSGAYEVWEGKPMPKIVSESSLLVEFTSDRSTAYSGFEMQWKRQAQSESACSTFSFRKQISGSVNFLPSPYTDRQFCSWLIAPPGVGSVTIEFKELTIEGGSDTVTIKGCKDILCENEAVELGVWSGTYGQDELPPGVFWDGATDAGEILVRVDFFADGNTGTEAASRGFQLEYTSQRGTPIQPESKCPIVDGAGPCPSLDCCSLRSSACVDGQCKECPVGATCFHGQFIRGKYNGEKWLLDRTEGEYYISECPPGFQKVRPMADGVYEWSKAQCRPCGAGRYIMHEENECQECPAGGVCECTEDAANEGVVVCKLNKDKIVINGQEIPFVGAWKRNETAGYFELDFCPRGTTLINTVKTTTSRGSDEAVEVFDASVQECRQCKDVEEYVITPNRIKKTTTVTLDGGETREVESYKYLKCQKCPVGGRCKNGIFESGKTKLKEEVWKGNLEMEQMILQHCPPGHERVTWSSISSFGVVAVNKTFDHDSQQCRKCADDQYIVNPDEDECTACPAGGLCDGSELSGKIFRPGESKSLDLWVVDLKGHQYRLASCPWGHRLVNKTKDSFSHDLQACEPCPAGYQCNQKNCTSSECEKCPPGTFKTTQSAKSCDKCPKGTYNTKTNATARADCILCPDSATTDILGATTPEDCICRKPNTYTRVTMTEDGEFSVVCQSCPKGGLCVGGKVRGKAEGVKFEKDNTTGHSRIIACPIGYVRVRSDIEGNEGNDDCVRCPAGSYLLDQKWVNDSINYRAECEDCPTGATCGGGSVIPGEGFWRNLAAEQAYLTGKTALPIGPDDEMYQYYENYLGEYDDPSSRGQGDIWAEMEQQYEWENSWGGPGSNEAPCDFTDYECMDNYFSGGSRCPPRECINDRPPTSCEEVEAYKDQVAECYQAADCCSSWNTEVEMILMMSRGSLSDCDFSTVCGSGEGGGSPGFGPGSGPPPGFGPPPGYDYGPGGELSSTPVGCSEPMGSCSSPLGPCMITPPSSCEEVDAIRDELEGCYASCGCCSSYPTDVGILKSMGLSGCDFGSCGEFDTNTDNDDYGGGAGDYYGVPDGSCSSAWPSCMPMTEPSSCEEVDAMKNEIQACYASSGCCSWYPTDVGVIKNYAPGLSGCDFGSCGEFDTNTDNEDYGGGGEFPGGAPPGYGGRRLFSGPGSETTSQQTRKDRTLGFDFYYDYYNFGYQHDAGRRSSPSESEMRDRESEMGGPPGPPESEMRDRERFYYEMRGKALVFPCPAGNCLERNQCREGHHGPVCGICDDGWVRTGEGLCEKCRTDEGDSPKKELGMALFFAAATLIYGYFSVYPMVCPLLGVKKVSEEKLREYKAKFEGVRAKLQGLFKICVSALQVSSSFVSTFSVEWPGSFTGLMGVAWVTQLDMLTLPSAACMTEGFSFNDMLFAKTLGPLLITIFLALPPLIVALRGWKYSIPIIDDCTGLSRPASRTKPGWNWKWWKKKPEGAAEEAGVTETQRENLNRFPESYHATIDAFWYAMVLFWYLLYPMCSIAALSALNCRDVGFEQRLLAADYSEICPQDPAGDQDLLLYVALMILVYPIGLPLLLLIALELNNIPALAMDLQNKAVLKAMMEHIRDVKGTGVQIQNDDPATPTDTEEGKGFLLQTASVTRQASSYSQDPTTPTVTKEGKDFSLRGASACSQDFATRRASTCSQAALLGPRRRASIVSLYTEAVHHQNPGVLLESMCPPGVRGSCLLEYFCLVLGKPPCALFGDPKVKKPISAVAYLRALWLLDKANPKSQMPAKESKDKTLTTLTAKEKKFLMVFQAWLEKLKEPESVDTSEEETFLGIMKETELTKRSSSWWSFFGANKETTNEEKYDYDTLLELAQPSPFSPYGGTEEEQQAQLGADTSISNDAADKDIEQLRLQELCAQFLELVDKQARIYALLARSSRRASRRDWRKNMQDISWWKNQQEKLFCVQIHDKIDSITLMDPKDCNAKTIHMSLDAFARHKATKERIKVLLNAIFTSFDIDEVKQTVRSCWNVLDLGDDPDVKKPEDPKEEKVSQGCGSVRSAVEKCLQLYQKGLEWCKTKIMGTPPEWKTNALHHSLLKIANHLLRQDIIALPALSWDIQEEPEKAEKEYLDTKAQAALTAAIAFANENQHRQGQSPTDHADNEIPDGKPVPSAAEVEHACTLCEDVLFLRPSISWVNIHAKYEGIFKKRCEFVIMTNVEFCKAAKKGIDRVGFLFKTYQVGYWYFELIEMIRKLLMTAILIFLFPGTPGQILSGLVLSLLFLYIYMQTTPFRDPELDHLQISTLVAQHCTLIYGIMAYMNMHKMDGAKDSTGMVGWIVTLMNVYCFVAPIYNHFSKIFQGFGMAKQAVNDIIAGFDGLATVWGWIRNCLPCCLGAGSAAAAAAVATGTDGGRIGTSAPRQYSCRTGTLSTQQESASHTDEMGEGGPCEKSSKADETKDTYAKQDMAIEISSRLDQLQDGAMIQDDPILERNIEISTASPPPRPPRRRSSVEISLSPAEKESGAEGRSESAFPAPNNNGAEGRDDDFASIFRSFA